MKTQEEIEQIAEKYATSIYGFSNENYIDYLVCKRHYIEAYSQCQEDILMDIDLDLAMIEDCAKGELGNNITELRVKIDKLLNL